jgi:hypothetical protein
VAAGAIASNTVAVTLGAWTPQQSILYIARHMEAQIRILTDRNWDGDDMDRRRREAITENLMLLLQQLRNAAGQI